MFRPKGDTWMNLRPWVTIVVAIWTANAYGATYYVDALDGNDGFAGTSTNQPWRTLTRLNTQTLAPGDSVLLRRGCEWRETLSVLHGGTPGTPIVYGAYGTGARPLIIGSNPTAGWVIEDVARHLWRTHVPWTPTPASPSLDVVYFAGERGVKRHSLAEVDSASEWYWNSSNQMLYVYCLDTPTGIETAARDHGVLGRDGFGLTYIVVEDIEIKQTNSKLILVGAGNHYWTIRNIVGHHNGRCDDIEDGSMGNDRVGISVRRCNNTLVTGCLIYETGENGVQITGGSNNIVEHCTIYNPHHHAIDMKGAPLWTCRDNVIRYNRVYATWSYDTQVNGIALVNDGENADLLNTRIHHNVVYNIPDSGIIIYGVKITETQILNNTLVDCHSHNIHLLNGPSTTTIINNIAVTSGSGWRPTLRIESAAGKSFDYNCWMNIPAGSDMIQVNTTDYQTLAAYQAATGLDAHSISTAPLFADPANRDYHLNDGCLCIGGGTPVGILEDIEGEPIPQTGAVSMGAYEHPVSGVLAIVQQPHGAKKCLLQTHTFYVGARGGTGTIRYQWYKDNDAVPDATDSAYVTPPLSEADSGEYYVVVSDDSGTSLTSDVAYLEVGPFAMPVSKSAAVLTLTLLLACVYLLMPQHTLFRC